MESYVEAMSPTAVNSGRTVNAREAVHVRLKQNFITVIVMFSSPDLIGQIKSRRMRWAGHVARMGEGRNVYRVLVGKPEVKRPLERPRRRWKDGIRMDPREIGWGGCGVDSTGSG
jgi:hypothetical protein